MAKRTKDTTPICTIVAEDITSRAESLLSRRLGLDGKTMQPPEPVQDQYLSYPTYEHEQNDAHQSTHDKRDYDTHHIVELLNKEDVSPLENLAKKLGNLNKYVDTLSLSAEARKDIHISLPTLIFLFKAAEYLGQAEDEFDTSSIWSDEHMSLIPEIPDESAAREYQVTISQALALVNLGVNYANSQGTFAAEMKEAFEKVVRDFQSDDEQFQTPSVLTGAILLRKDLDFNVDNLIKLARAEISTSSANNLEPIDTAVVVENEEVLNTITSSEDDRSLNTPIRKRWRFTRRFPWITKI